MLQLMRDFSFDGLKAVKLNYHMCVDTSITVAWVVIDALFRGFRVAY
jgi:hypothetical protein